MSPASTSRSPRPPVRDRLLDVADELFYAEGIHAVGIDRLLAEAGVAKASLYQHFSSKDDLVAAYLQRQLDRGQDDLDRRMARVEGSPAERIVVLFELLGKWMASRAFRGCPFINAAAEYPDADHPVQQVIAEHRARSLARLRALVAQLKTEEPELADSLMLLYDGALVAGDLGSGRKAGRSVVATVRRLLAADACA